MGIHCLFLSLARSAEECFLVFSPLKMLKFVVASCLAAAAAGQFVDPKNAKILKEQRFNAGDGRFGSAFAQEDGVVFREETGAAGERVGQYGYIGDDGQTYTVKYTAGKDGFRILDGSHIPTGANGLNSAPFNPKQAAPVQSAPVVQAAPTPVQQVAAPVDYDYVDAPVDPNFNPFINPHDASHQAGHLAGHLAGHQAPQQTFQPQQQSFAFQQTTTPAPRRFFPPGQLKLNRFETGFNFDFA